MYAFRGHACIWAKVLSVRGLQNTHMSILSVLSMKTARIMDGSVKNEFPSMKNAKIMDGSMRLKLTKHQNESLLIYNGKSERICKAACWQNAGKLITESYASYAKGLAPLALCR